MGQRNFGTTIAIRRNGQSVGAKIERVLFDIPERYQSDYPGAAGLVNFRGMVSAVYEDAQGRFLELSDKPIRMLYALGTWAARRD